MVAPKGASHKSTIVSGLIVRSRDSFGIETALSHVDPANPLFGLAMYHHYFGPDYYSFNCGGVHFIGLNSVDVSGTSYYGHVDSVQLAWLARDLKTVALETPVVTFEHIPMLSAMNEFDGYDDDPPAPTPITVNGKTSFRHEVSNAGDVLTVLRNHHKHVLAIGAHSHVGERVTLFNEGVRTRFEQSPAGAETVCVPIWRREIHRRERAHRRRHAHRGRRGQGESNAEINAPKDRARSGPDTLLAVHLRDESPQRARVHLGKHAQLPAQSRLAHRANLIDGDLRPFAGDADANPRAPCGMEL